MAMDKARLKADMKTKALAALPQDYDKAMWGKIVEAISDAAADAVITEITTNAVVVSTAVT